MPGKEMNTSWTFTDPRDTHKACIGKIAASVLVKMFINGNKVAVMNGKVFSNVNNIQLIISENQKKKID